MPTHPLRSRAPASAFAVLRHAWLSAALLLLATGAANAQPFGAWLTLAGHPTHGGVEIPHSAVLNPTAAFTFEAWVAITGSTAGEDCRSIAGKHWQQAWWIGQCTVDGKRTLRSYLKGSASARNGGEIPNGVWTHVAVVFTGTQRRHYINGELAASFPETGPLTTSASPVRIGSDVAWQFTPQGAIDEVRLWNVARTQGQIRANLNVPTTAAQPGLVALWALNGNAQDTLGPHDGALFGAGVGFLTFPVALNCTDSATGLCIQDERFLVRMFWRTNPAPGTDTDGVGTVVTSAAESGLYWFFSSSNWEVLVKVLEGCGLNNRFWVFSASATNVFYRMEVTDVRAGAQKIYFNYPGPPAPAVTDTGAFATCP